MYPFRFRSITSPTLITVDGRKDLAERIIATGWTQRALITILHGQIVIRRIAFMNDNGIWEESNTYESKQDIQIIKILQEAREVVFYRQHFQKLLHFK